MFISAPALGRGLQGGPGGPSPQHGEGLLPAASRGGMAAALTGTLQSDHPLGGAGGGPRPLGAAFAEGRGARGTPGPSADELPQRRRCHGRGRAAARGAGPRSRPSLQPPGFNRTENYRETTVMGVGLRRGPRKGEKGLAGGGGVLRDSPCSPSGRRGLGAL